MAFVGETIPKERTGSAMGLLGTMSAVGTALGPSLGGVLIAGFGWQAIFLVNLPLGLMAVLLAARFLPPDQEPKRDRPRFDTMGTLVLASTLAAYALAMTVGRGDFGALNVGLLLVALLGVGAFLRVEAKAASPLVRIAMFRDRALAAGFAMSALVTTVVMATLVVGPFYLAGALALDAAGVGLAMSAGPVVAALTGVPAGRLVDRVGASGTAIAGLILMVAGCSLLAAVGAAFGVLGYIGPLVGITAGYAIFQAANNTAVMRDIHPERRGVVSGLLNLSRNLGLITGASAMGAVFALNSGASGMSMAQPADVVTGMRITFLVAASLSAAALVVAIGSRGGDEPEGPPEKGALRERSQ
jgi:MFS family permease